MPPALYVSLSQATQRSAPTSRRLPGGHGPVGAIVGDVDGLRLAVGPVAGVDGALVAVLGSLAGTLGLFVGVAVVGASDGVAVVGAPVGADVGRGPT